VFWIPNILFLLHQIAIQNKKMKKAVDNDNVASVDNNMHHVLLLLEIYKIVDIKKKIDIVTRIELHRIEDIWYHCDDIYIDPNQM
jgi:hypothetical protein